MSVNGFEAGYFFEFVHKPPLWHRFVSKRWKMHVESPIILKNLDYFRCHRNTLTSHSAFSNDNWRGIMSFKTMSFGLVSASCLFLASGAMAATYDFVYTGIIETWTATSTGDYRVTAVEVRRLRGHLA